MYRAVIMADVKEMCELNQLEAIKILKGNRMTEYSKRQEAGGAHYSVIPRSIEV